MKVHPLADLFPQIEGRELEELVEDIRNNGLRVPIVLDREGRLLDGRNRLRACRAAGVEPRFETWDGRGAVAELIVSLNLKRRHLNESQRAMLAAKLRERQGLFDQRTNWSSGNSADQTAALLNVSPMSVKRAAKLLRSGDRKLIKAVEAGKVKVSKAAELAGGGQKRRPEPQAGLWLWASPDQLDEAIKQLEECGYQRPRQVILLAPLGRQPAARSEDRIAPA